MMATMFFLFFFGFFYSILIVLKAARIPYISVFFFCALPPCFLIELFLMVFIVIARLFFFFNLLSVVSYHNYNLVFFCLFVSLLLAFLFVWQLLPENRI